MLAEVESGTGEALPTCPFRAATGVPCPLCGGTRAMQLASGGDPDFLRFNAFWVALFAVCALTGAVALAATRAGRSVLRRPGPTTVKGLVAAVVVLAWGCALANRDAIVA